MKSTLAKEMPKYDHDIVKIKTVEPVVGYDDCYKISAEVTSSAMRIGGVPMQDYVVKLKDNKIEKGTYITGGLLETTSELVCKDSDKSVMPQEPSSTSHKELNYSIKFPDGWKVERPNSEVDSIVAYSKELESMYTVSRLGRYSDAQDISLARAQALGDNRLENMRHTYPDAKLRSADVIRNLNGREAMILTYQLNTRYNEINILVPTREYTYQISFIGPMSVLKATSNTVQSFKILQ